MKWQADWLLAKEENEKAKVLTVCWLTTTLVFTPYSYFKEEELQSHRN
jgi:hypothetical protein